MARRQKGKRLPADAPIITDKLAVIPMLPDNVTVKTDSQGRAHLRQQIPLTGLKKRIADRMGYNYAKAMMLDDRGTAFIMLVDGQTPLDVIITRMAEQFDTPRDEMRDAVLLFTKTLMIKQVIVLASSETRSRNKDE